MDKKAPDEQEAVTAWITKYALTRGVFSITAEICDGAHSGIITQTGVRYGYCYHKGEWFLTETAAQADAQMKRDRKITSLEKQILKLKNLTF